MVKCGAFALMWGSTFDKSSLHIVDHVKSLGFDGIEIVLDSETLKNFPKRELKERVNECSLAVTFCAGLKPNQNVSVENKQIRHRGIEFLKRCVDTVAEFNGDFLAGILYAVWGGFTGNPPTEDELTWSSDSIREVARYANSVKIDIAIEPCSRFECYMLATVEDAQRYIKKVGEPNVGLLLDTFQMNIEEKSLPNAIIAAGDKLYHFHVCENDRGVPGTGHTDWEGVFGALKKIKYNRWLTVESFWPTPGGGTGAAAKIFRELAPSPDHIAKGGLELIRRFFSTC